MSDIPKDFTQWYNNRFSNRDPLCCEHGMEDMEEAYQAGCAHDVDGLIEEIRAKYISADEHDEIVECCSIESIIRKHFGKE